MISAKVAAEAEVAPILIQTILFQSHSTVKYIQPYSTLTSKANTINTKILNMLVCSSQERGLLFSRFFSPMRNFFPFQLIFHIISLCRIPNQCPRRVIMISRKNILMFMRIHLYKCVLKTSWLKTAVFFCLGAAF